MSLHLFFQSNDSTVFFFTLGAEYEPIGFIKTPSAVTHLAWSPGKFVRTFYDVVNYIENVSVDGMLVDVILLTIIQHLHLAIMTK